MEHRLAAIMITDVVGYSRLMERDEAGTLERLKEWRSVVLEPIVQVHKGRIIKVMGDGTLIELPSALNAVQCALDLQRRMAETAAGFALRIGINIGDVIGDGDDVYGDGVNIAARLESLAGPGGICISGKVYEEVRGKLAIAFEGLGEVALKNITRPVQAYRLRDGAAGDVAAPPQSKLTIPDRPSLVVLPFQNMSGDAEQEYFADGMVEDITTALARIRWLFVIARNSAFTYKGRAVDVKQVGKDLGVRYVLEGSVRKAGNRVRVTGQLIDAATGTHLWADRFDGDLADVFELQDQVTARVVGIIAPKLEMAEMERAKRKPTESLDAYDFYLRGLAAFHRFSKTDNVEALAMFKKAIAGDDRFASAYGMAARCYLQRKGFGFGPLQAADIAETKQLAAKAAECGRDDAVALCTAGFSLIVVAGDLDDGAALIDRSLELNPNLAWIWHFSALAKAFLGKPEIALDHAARAMRLSPQDPQMFAMQVAAAFAHFVAGDPATALAMAEDALRIQPNFLVGLCVVAASAGLCGRTAQAEKAMAQLRALNPNLKQANLNELLPLRRHEDIVRWAEGLQRAGLPA
jgi:TolB-like protein/class 3 adenylate cyclase/tetratricopeptide (TPR) repeat protein